MRRVICEALLQAIARARKQGTRPVDVNHEVCSGTTCAPWPLAGNLYACPWTGRIHLCGQDDCPWEIARGSGGEGDAERQREVCTVTGETRALRDLDCIGHVYSEHLKVVRDEDGGGGGGGKGRGWGKPSRKRKRPTNDAERRMEELYDYARMTSSLPGMGRNIGAALKRHDPYGSRNGGGDGGGGGGGESAHVRTARRMADAQRSEASHELTTTRAMAWLLSTRAEGVADGGMAAWAAARAASEIAKARRSAKARAQKMLSASADLGIRVSIRNLLVPWAQSVALVEQRAARRRRLQPRDIRIMEMVLRARCALLWPVFSEARGAFLDARNASAGRKPRARSSLYLSPVTFNYTTHVLSVAFRSGTGVVDHCEETNTSRWLLAPIPLLNVVLPSEHDLKGVCLRDDEEVRQRSYSRAQGGVERWLKEAVARSAITSPLILRHVDALDDYLPLLRAEGFDTGI
jgi:hypothetical protein